jgi:hypothetical protein
MYYVRLFLTFFSSGSCVFIFSHFTHVFTHFYPLLLSELICRHFSLYFFYPVLLLLSFFFF